MSVWVSAITGHPWTEFSEAMIQRISRAASGEDIAPRWFGRPGFKSPEVDFETHGYVPFFLPRNYILYFSRNIMELTLAVRWSTILINEGQRRQFLSACKAVAQLADSGEVILLPDGTALEDSVNAGVTYAEFKRLAAERFGPPDLEIAKIYTEMEIRCFGQDRVHYFLVKTAEL